VNPHAPIARVVGCWGATCRSHKAAHGSSAWSAAVRLQHSEYGDRYGGYDASARAQMVRAGTYRYCDADFAGDSGTRKSTTGFVFMLNGGVIS
jgi:hypothetical protein